MKIKEGFALSKIGDAYYAVPVIPSEKIGDGMIKLNETAYFLWKKLESGCSEAELADALCSEYEVELEDALRDIKSFEALLGKADILEGDA